MLIPTYQSANKLRNAFVYFYKFCKSVEPFAQLTIYWGVWTYEDIQLYATYVARFPDDSLINMLTRFAWVCDLNLKKCLQYAHLSYGEI